MTVENLDHKTAAEEVKKISEVNRSGNALYKAPYYLGAASVDVIFSVAS